MKKFSLAAILICCAAPAFHAQQAKFKPKQKKPDISKKVTEDSNLSQKSIVRTFGLNTITTGNSDVFIGGHGTSFDDDKVRGYTLFLKISNGEAKFKKLPFLSDIRDMFFLDNMTGWISGFKGMYKTTDGGENWKKYGSDDIINGPLFFLDEKTGWYFSSNNRLKRIEGNRVTELKDFNGEFWGAKKMQFTSRTHGWLRMIKPYKHVFLRTEDGGKTWETIDFYKNSIDDFQFINDYEGFALGDDGLYSTSDGGKTWNLIKEDDEDGSFHKLFFADRNRGLIIGENSCFTVDAGTNWKCAELPKELIIEKAVITDNNEAWLLAEPGEVYFLEFGKTNWQRKPLSYGKVKF